MENTPRRITTVITHNEGQVKAVSPCRSGEVCRCAAYPFPHRSGSGDCYSRAETYGEMKERLDWEREQEELRNWQR